MTSMGVADNSKVLHFMIHVSQSINAFTGNKFSRLTQLTLFSMPSSFCTPSQIDEKDTINAALEYTYHQMKTKDIENVPRLLMSILLSYEKDGVPTIMSLPRDVIMDLIVSLGVADNVDVLRCMKRVSQFICTDRMCICRSHVYVAWLFLI